MKAIPVCTKSIRENYTYITIATLVIAVIVGLFTSRPGVSMRQSEIPLIVVLITVMNSKGLAPLPIAVSLAF